MNRVNWVRGGCVGEFGGIDLQSLTEVPSEALTSARKPYFSLVLILRPFILVLIRVYIKYFLLVLIHVHIYYVSFHEGHNRTDLSNIEWNLLKLVNRVSYLESTVTSIFSLDEEISTLIGKAATTFGKLRQRAWNSRKLILKAKVMTYQTCLVNTVLYGSKTWTPYGR